MVDASKLNGADAASCYVQLVKAANNLHAALLTASRTPDDPFAVEAIKRVQENLEVLKADWRDRFPEVVAPIPLPPAA